jgi:hypothetical protein
MYLKTNGNLPFLKLSSDRKDDIAPLATINYSQVLLLYEILRFRVPHYISALVSRVWAKDL